MLAVVYVVNVHSSMSTCMLTNFGKFDINVIIDKRQKEQ